MTTVHVPKLANEFSIYNTYQKVEKAGKYSTIHYLVSCGAYPADHLQDPAYTNFKYLTLSTHDKKIRKYKNRRAYIYFSGAYNKLYELKKGYNVIYIPRGQISANSGDNDSATISATLNDVKIISIEWSNHLNGTEGCYTCSDSNGNDAKLSDGSTSAVYYQKLTRSKNARWNSLYGNFVGGDVPFTGHNSLKISTEINGWGLDPNDPDTSSIYLENKRTVRPRQYTAGEIKILNNTYDYPFYGGDFSIVFENVNRIPELYTWIDSLASPKHEYQFNYINGVGRYCHIWSALNPSYDPQTGFEREAFFVNAPIIGYIAKMCCIECTVDVNRMLMAAGYQTCNVQNTGDGMQSAGATDIMRRTISPKMIDAFNRAFGNNGRIYVIHYRYNKDGFSNWSPSSWKVYKNYTASNQSELKKVLSEILFDIQYFAEYQDAKIVN